MTFLADLSTMSLTLLQNRTSHWLEWIVDPLILIGIILSVLLFAMPEHR